MRKKGTREENVERVERTCDKKKLFFKKWRREEVSEIVTDGTGARQGCNLSQSAIFYRIKTTLWP